MPKTMYLYRVKQTYYFRCRIPSDLVATFPLAELRRSLKTTSLTQARKLLKAWCYKAWCYKAWCYKAEHTFTLVRSGMLAQDQIRGLAEAFCYEGGKPKSCDGGGLVEDSQPAANISAAIRDYRLSWLVRKYVEEYKSTEKADGPSIYEIETKCWMFTRIVGKGRIRVLTKEEEITVVSLLRDTEHNKKRSYYPEAADLIEVLVDTGCRLSEVLNLQYDDINFATNLISIWINKGDKPRSIPMTKRVGGILLARQVGNPVKPFTIDIDQAQKAWFWVRKRIMLEDGREFVMHSLRHTCATRLLDGGVDLYTVKEWLGHSTIQVTERYAHLNPGKLTHAAEALEAESAETEKNDNPH